MTGGIGSAVGSVRSFPAVNLADSVSRQIVISSATAEETLSERRADAINHPIPGIRKRVGIVIAAKSIDTVAARQ